MTTKREYAISLGLAKPTRGRMSAEAHAAINKAIAEGMTFTDATAAPRVKVDRVVSDDSPKVESDAPVEDKRKPWEIPTPDRRRDRMADVYETADGVRKSYRDCCAVCQFSIGWCTCAVPMHITVNSDLIPLTPVLTRA